MPQDEPGHVITAASVEELRRLTSDSVTELPTFVEQRTVRTALVSHARSHPDEAAFVFRTGRELSEWTWGDTARIAVAVGTSLRRTYGLGAGDAVVLDVPNGPAWLAIDLGAQFAGAYTIPLYSGAPTDSVQGALAAIDEASRPKLFFTNRPEPEGSFATKARVEPATIQHLTALISQALSEGGDADSLDTAQTRIACGVYVRPEARAESGGKVLAVGHWHVAEQCSALRGAFGLRGLADANTPAELVDRRLSLMPWAHIVERLQSVYTDIVAGVCTFVPCDRRDVLEEFRVARPTLFSGSNHLFGHLRDRLIDSIEELVDDAVDLSEAFSDLETESALRLMTQEVPPELSARCEQCRMDLLPVVEILVGEGLRLLTSASRLFDADVVLFYEALQKRIYRGYGGNRLGGLVTTNSPGNWRLDTFGKALSPYKISAEKHLSVKAPMIWPVTADGTSTASVPIDTADLAEIDDGWLRIVGIDEEVAGARISLRGINLVPTKEESYLMNDPLVDQAISVAGEMLIVADPQALDNWARRWGVSAGEPPELDREVIERFQVLTDLPVLLHRNRMELKQRLREGPKSSSWSHVDEIDTAITALADPLISLGDDPAGEGVLRSQGAVPWLEEVEAHDIVVEPPGSAQVGPDEQGPTVASRPVADTGSTTGTVEAPALNGEPVQREELEVLRRERREDAKLRREQSRREQAARREERRAAKARRRADRKESKATRRSERVEKSARRKEARQHRRKERAKHRRAVADQKGESDEGPGQAHRRPSPG